jgi:hypothetical protein
MRAAALRSRAEREYLLGQRDGRGGSYSMYEPGALAGLDGRGGRFNAELLPGFYAGGTGKSVRSVCGQMGQYIEEYATEAYVGPVRNVTRTRGAYSPGRAASPRDGHSSQRSSRADHDSAAADGTVRVPSARKALARLASAPRLPLPASYGTRLGLEEVSECPHDAARVLLF